MLLNSPSNSNTRIRMNNYPRRKSPAAWPCPFLFSRFTSMSVFSIFVDARGCWNERENTGAKGRTGRTEKTRTKKEEVSEIDIELTRAVSSMPGLNDRKKAKEDRMERCVKSCRVHVDWCRSFLSAHVGPRQPLYIYFVRPLIRPLLYRVTSLTPNRAPFNSRSLTSSVQQTSPLLLFDLIFSLSKFKSWPMALGKLRADWNVIKDDKNLVEEQSGGMTTGKCFCCTGNRLYWARIIHNKNKRKTRNDHAILISCSTSVFGQDPGRWSCWTTTSLTVHGKILKYAWEELGKNKRGPYLDWDLVFKLGTGSFWIRR